MDETTWTALALVLTLLCGGYTYWAFRHRGAAAGVRGLALTLLPPAAWATGTLKLFTKIVDAVVDWAAGLVLSPLTWAGFGLAGLAVVLYVVGGVAAARSLGSAPPSAGRDGAAPPPQQLPAGRPKRSEPVIDDELAEIEALLKKRGIT